MVKGLESVLIYSKNPKVMADFYKDKVGLKLTNESIMGEGDNEAEVYGFESENKSDIYIVDEKAAGGSVGTTGRIILNIEVDDINSETQRLEATGARKITDVYHLQGYGWVSTFEDPDGNYVCLVQVKES